jgi:hypothetical protein
MNRRVASAQAALNRTMNTGLVVDGIYGPKTRAAVIAFQRSHALKPDGILGPRTYAALGIPSGPVPGPVPPAPTAGPIAPEQRETDPSQLTLYFRMPHGGENPSAKPLTAVFFPSGFQPNVLLDCIVWLQGHHAGVPSMSIDRYLSGSWIPYFRFREGINDTGRPFVLIAPTLGPTSQAGALVRPGGFDAWMDRVLASIGIHGPFGGQTPRLRNLILACHSGGGAPMRFIALNTRKYAANLRECWGFDCMYNGPDPTEWPAWARSNPDKRLYVYWASTTRTNSKAIEAQAVPNIVVQQSSTGEHNRVPITYWGERIRNFGGLITQQQQQFIA